MSVREEEFKSQFDGRTLFRLLRQALPHWPSLTGFMVAALVVSTLDGYFTFLNKQIIDKGILSQDWKELHSLVVVYGLLIIVHSIVVFLHNFFTEYLGHIVRYDLRRKLFEHIQKLSYAFFDQTPVGWIMARVTSDTNQVSDLVSWGLLNLSWCSTRLITTLYFMILINWQLALIVFITAPALWIISLWFRMRLVAEFRRVRKINSHITASYNESITGVRTIKALGREQGNNKEFSRQAVELYNTSYRATWISALFSPAVQLVGSLAVGTIVWYGGWQTHVGFMTIGGIQAFISYALSLLWPMDRLAGTFTDMQNAIASAERIFSLLDKPLAIVDHPGSINPGSIRGDIEFDHVFFWYEPDHPVLMDVTLKVHQGESIALVGPTGGGKSTIVNLLCRFYEPKQGSIRIRERDYTTLTQHAIQSRIGVVLQTPHLFSGTIRENIHYGRLDATDSEVEEAAKRVCAHDFIISLPKGYETEVGERGVLLSVGQKQLISLARALLVRPDLFIMDEATSSVDTITEMLLQKGMEQMMEKCTSLIIAHRLSTIKRADRILFIANGRIAETGTHADLMNVRGRYYSLYLEQFRYELEQKYNAFSESYSATVSGV